MSKNNQTTRTLVGVGNAAMLAAGNGVADLAVGQLGMFDAKTGVSIDGSTPAKEFFLAVGLDRDGDATMDDIKQSAGQAIQTANVVAYNFREHSAARPQIQVVGGYKGACDTDFTLRVEMRDQENYRTNGFVQSTKIVGIHTAECDGCEGCPSGDANEITQLLLAEIALDENSPIMTAQAVARQDITTATINAATSTYTMTTVDPAAGEALVAVDLLALIEYNALQTAEADKFFSDVEITSVPLAINNAVYDLKYFHPRQRLLVISAVEGFATVTETQAAAFEEGNGYDVSRQEWHESGNAQNRPYVLSDATGVPISLDIFADKTAKYDQFVLEYNVKYAGGFQDFDTPLRTIIAVPAASTVTRNSVAAFLDAQLAGLGFDAKADDVAAATTTATTVSPTTDIDDVDEDGLG
jgi:hypothetical protein